MKYNKFNLTKLILCFLAFALFLTACGGEEESVSDISNEEAESSFETVSEDESEEPQSLDFTLDMALDLLESDRLITDIFLNNALCNRQTVKSVPVAASSRYSDYSVIEKLLLSTYTQTKILNLR